MANYARMLIINLITCSHTECWYSSRRAFSHMNLNLNIFFGTHIYKNNTLAPKYDHITYAYHTYLVWGYWAYMKANMWTVIKICVFLVCGRQRIWLLRDWLWRPRWYFNPPRAYLVNMCDFERCHHNGARPSTATVMKCDMSYIMFLWILYNFRWSDHAIQ